MNAHTHVPAPLRRLSEIVAEYEEKHEGATEAVEAMKAAIADLDRAGTIAATFAESFHSLHAPDPRAVQRNLLRSAWRHVHDGLNIPHIATAKDKARIERLLADPPPFTLQNIRDQFGDYLIDPRGHALRGLAEAFVDLDPAFRSHDKMRIGVKGLPKRVIIANAASRWGYGSDQLRDCMNALLAYRGEPKLDYRAFAGITKEATRHGEGDWPGGRVKFFSNGNAHLFFDADALQDINRGLAEYYGEVLPDCPEEAPQKRKTGTAVASDLQFYPTPEKAADELVAFAQIREGERVLEPSCGNGRLLDAIRRACPSAKALGIEVDPGRAQASRLAGHSVITANFLEHAPAPEFDVVVMNPPFFGRHYLKHINHALRFLKPGGRLVSILPATAWHDHKELPGSDKARGYWERDVWRDLPVGAFRESGTNICTGIWRHFA